MDFNIIDLSNPLWTEILQTVRHDIYQLPEYIALEASRSNAIPEAIIISEGDKTWFVPYLLSPVGDIISDGFLNQDIFDLKSPYGYPGILLSEAAIADSEFITAAFSQFQQILKDKGVCSAFLRMHPILNENLEDILPPDTLTPNGKTVSVDLRIPEAKLWSDTRKGHRSTINKCKRLGMEAKIVSTQTYIEVFNDIYQETMERVGAAARYYSFDLTYYQEMCKALDNKLHMCIVEYENEVACAGLYTEVCGIVQSTLGGTRDKYVSLSPSSLETDYARYWAHRRGNEFLHLGGGVGGEKDPVFNFKAGFSKLTHNFYTMRLIINHEQYEHLVDLRAKHLDTTSKILQESNFFPAYRATN